MPFVDIQTISFTLVAESILSLGLALLLFHYYRVYDRPYLRYWALTTAFFGISQALRFSLPDLLLAEFPLSLHHQLGYTVLITAQYFALSCLVIGAFDAIRVELPPLPIRRLIYLGSIMAGLCTYAVFVMPLPPQWVVLLGILLQYFVSGVALLGFTLMLYRQARTGMGPRLIVMSLTFLALKNIAFVGLYLLHPAATVIQIALELDTLFNLITLAMSAIGVVIWLLESERGHAISAIQKAEYLHSHDVLTGVLNRESLVSRIPMMLEHCRSNNRHLTLMLVGMNRFKAINDNIGIRGGDQVLMAVAERLQNLPSQPLAVSRISGDVFAVVFNHLKRRSFLLDLANDIKQAVERPLALEKVTINLSCSIGIARYPQHGNCAEVLLNKSTIALANTKQLDAEAVVFYVRGMDEPYSQLVHMEPDLRRALANDEFVLYLQPQWRTADQQLISFEALIRWQHPQRGLLGPGEFLPFIEQLGMASELDDWVIRHAAKCIHDWRQQLGFSVPLAVNLSAKHFQQPQLADKLRQLLDSYQLDSNDLELEITENVAMSDLKTGTNVISSLKQQGIKVAIDDFGTGYSSLTYLRRLPIDKIKIDRSFIAELQESQADITIVRALIRLAHGLGKQVVAEGVETPQQLKLLQELDCDVIQGYLLSPPLAERHASQLLAERGQRPQANADQNSFTG
ncbi:putative bifunctional diguanylate cyclase/phosphodiesterase [Idiomarina xiamenensis]|uniref:cyclic-guanylate-specific phosphodiesterase n=1 Tax=Idiomarina xiamenensis 10-D-4 TaxID=740709 RepID=K2K2H8_9GAMM|nr:EAL domain-containing protein [Idiomarina xiamenensis]EKE80897.1 signal protein [Idiomarina xiamenensis 10-D-4]